MEPYDMKKRALFALFSTCFLAALCCSPGQVVAAGKPKADLRGAGSTFAAPLYRSWIKNFSTTAPGFTVSYDAIGSGEGTRLFMAGEVDFGGSDAAMNDEQIALVKNGVQLIPATAGLIALAYNLPDVAGQLRLSRDVYSDIFLGKIRKWNDPRIKEINPDLKLPNMYITTVTRADSSGTTWAFTNHLHSISPQWRQSGIGVVKKADWPGNSMQINYNEGVATKIKYSWGSIGYVHYGVAKMAGLKMAALENKDKQFIAPSDTIGTQTLASNAVDMPKNLRAFLPDPSGSDSYPIITYSWILLNSAYPEKIQAERAKEFVKWGLLEGQKSAVAYGYIALPEPVVTAALKELSTVQ